MLSSPHNPLVKHWAKLRLDREYRRQQGSLMIEGIKPILEVQSEIKCVICTEEKAPLFAHLADCWIVSEAIMKKISGMTSPEGALAEVHLPSFSTLKGVKHLLALDGINDPGNLGTLLRTALALGWEGVYLLPNSCDLFNEKALRAARGAHFRLHLAVGTVQGLRQIAINNDLEPLVAHLDGLAPEELSQQKGRLLVLGNEAHGASKEVHDFCSKITVPMQGEMESLNVAVAGGILMYLLRK
jgi:TrmH family RNA methyltransferase